MVPASLPDGSGIAAASATAGAGFEAATQGLSRAGAMAGDIVANAVPEFVTQFIPFLGVMP